MYWLGHKEITELVVYEFMWNLCELWCIDESVGRVHAARQWRGNNSICAVNQRELT